MESVFRGLAVYVVLLMVTRLSGRRSLAQVTPFDFVLLLIIAETTQQALLGDDFSVTNAFVLIVTLFFADVLMSFLKQWSSRAALLLDGTPTVLVSRGRIDREAMRRARLNLDDIMKAAREQHGLRRLDQVDFAVLEVSGTLSIVPVGED